MLNKTIIILLPISPDETGQWIMLDPNPVRILAGTVRRTYPYSAHAQMQSAHQLIIHSNFDTRRLTDDIGLVKVKYLQYKVSFITSILP